MANSSERKPALFGFGERHGLHVTAILIDEVSGAHGITVDECGGLVRHVDERFDVFAHHLVPGFKQAHPEGTQRLDEAEEVVNVVLHGAQAGVVIRRGFGKARGFHLFYLDGFFLLPTKPSHASYDSWVSPDKTTLRALARRRRVPETMQLEDVERLRLFLDWLPAEPGVCATYVSVDGEPDTVRLVDALVARGWEVRLPVLRREPDWARYSGWDKMRPAWRDIPEPTGPRLGADSLIEADVVLASCLAVDRDGFRLGVGGGWYDRALANRGNATVLAWSREAEVVDAVPREPHDVPCDGWVTERGVYKVH